MPELDPNIFKMKKCAEELIAKGDDDGLLALYWINRWIKNPTEVCDEDHLDKTNEKRFKPLFVHPNNFAWAFNCSSELDPNTHAYYAIYKVHRIAVKGKLTNNCGSPL
jgi:hypothetical protein